MAGHVLTLKMRRLPHLFEVTDVARKDHMCKPRILLDLTDITGLKKIIATEKPDTIVNCAGILNQAAESRPDIAIVINSYLPHFLEQVTKNSATRVIHISTDCVFSGSKGGYTEDDLKDGKGFYAQTKALGELNNGKDLTIRTSIIGPELNEDGIGLFNWFSGQQGAIKGYTQAFWTGVTTVGLANAIIDAIRQDIVGLYHLVNGEKISKYALLQLFLQHFRNSKVKEVIPYADYRSDKSLINTRTDKKLAVPTYDKMIGEMKEWIEDNGHLYSKYTSLI